MPLLNKHDPIVASIAREWRRLTDHPAGELPRTVVACSGGADSVALALAAAAIAGALRRDRLALAYVQHDMRDDAIVGPEVEAVGALAAGLGVPFLQGRAAVGSGRRTESAYRRLRYEALANLARDHGYAFVATAHHADDQLESVLMALARGGGPRGLRGIAPRRRIDDAIPRVLLIRPMLHTSHAQAVRMCTESSVAWHEDETNADPSRLRAALRHGAIAEIVRRLPSAAARASHTASLMRDVTHLLDQLADGAFTPPDGPWCRRTLRELPRIVLGHGLRRAIVRAAGPVADRITSRVLAPLVRAIGSDERAERRFDLARGTTISVAGDLVSVQHNGSLR